SSIVIGVKRTPAKRTSRGPAAGAATVWESAMSIGPTLWLAGAQISRNDDIEPADRAWNFCAIRQQHPRLPHAGRAEWNRLMTDAAYDASVVVLSYDRVHLLARTLRALVDPAVYRSV